MVVTQQMEEILAYFYRETGIFFKEKKELVASRIERFAAEKEFTDIHAFFHAVQQDGTLWQELVNLLTVNETYFYRETALIEVFVELVKARNGRCRVLCAPSSTGEEPYTIAMHLLEAKVSASDMSITAIDINSSVIEKAKAALYSRRSLHRTPELVINRYFYPQGEEQFTLRGDVKAMVDFKVMNLFETDTSSLGVFDAIFCRNLLIYFDKESRERAEKTLFDLLRPGGHLFVGHADLVENVIGMERKFERGYTYYQKPF